MSMFRSVWKMMPLMGLLMGATSSFADTISSSFPLSFTATGTTSTSDPISTPLPQFNPALGTLTGATIEVTIPNLVEYLNIAAGTIVTFSSGGLVFTPGYGTPYSATVSSAYIALNDPSDSDLTTLAPFSFTGVPSVNATLPTTPYSGNAPLDNSTVLLDTYLLSTLDSTYTVTSTGLSQLTGTGTLAVPFKVYPSGILPALQGVNLSFGMGSFTGTETLTYTYVPGAVPEPASLSLLAIAAPLLMRRRRRTA